MDKFDPRDYWQTRGEHYYTSAKRAKIEVADLMAWIAEHKPASILDVGSGWGRIYSHLKAQGLADNYTMVDFVDSMRQKCKKRTGILPDKWDGKTLSYDDDSFDLVLSVDVLLHVPPADIGRIFAEHVRVSRRWLYVIVVGLVYTPIKAEYCFWHDYLRLFGENRLRILKAQFYPCKQRMRAHWILQK